jgi:hypothetical protein
MPKIKNLKAKCLNPDTPDDYVNHLVSYDELIDKNWEHKTTHIFATDPQHAIEILQARYY